LVSHLRQHCENCGTLSTPQWRKGWHSEVLNHSVLLCNACGLKFHKNQFCPYCKYVYGKEQKISNIWLTCEYCARWVHVDCETQYGGCHNNQPYACPDCRNGVTPATISYATSPVASPRGSGLEPVPEPSFPEAHHTHHQKGEEEDVDMDSVASANLSTADIDSIVDEDAPLPASLGYGRYHQLMAEKETEQSIQ